MDSYARKILLEHLTGDLGPWPFKRHRHRSSWREYARAVKDETGRWPALARWEPTTERIPATNPLMAGAFWEILGGEPAPSYPYNAREMLRELGRQVAAAEAQVKREVRDAGSFY